MNNTEERGGVGGRWNRICRAAAISAIAASLVWGLCTPASAQTTVRDIVEQSKLKQSTTSSPTAPATDGRIRQAQRPGGAVQRVRSIPSRSSQNQNTPAAQQTGEPGNPNRPMNQGTAQEPISVDFVDAPLSEVVKAIGVFTGRNFLLDPTISSQKVTIISHHKIPPDLAFEFLETVLTFQNFEVVEALDGNLVRIGPKNLSGSDKLPIYTGKNQPHPGYDNRAIHIVQVQYANAEEVSQLLQSVGSQNAEITVFQYTNTLLIKDTADGIRNMFTVLESVDVPGYDINFEIFPLEYTRAEALAQQLEQVLLNNDDAGRNAPRQPARPTTVRSARGAATPNRPSNVIVGTADNTLRMVPDERLNALIVVATATQMEQVRSLILELDTPTPYESENFHHVALKNAKAEDVAAALEPLISTQPRQGAQQGSAATGEVQPFEKQVTITPYEPNNALVIVASPQDFQLLKAMIDQLDQPARQVSIEVMIIAVTIQDSFELSVEAAAIANEDFFGLSNAVNLANVLVSGPTALAGGGGTFGILDGTTTVLDPTTGSEVTVNNVPFLMKALETLSDVDVLSKPNLMTKNNAESRLFSGQNVPFITGQSDINPQSGFQSRNNIQRERVGIELTVTPRINDGDNVTLELLVASDEVIGSVAGLDVNETGITTAESEIATEVEVPDGQTAVIGGLIRDSHTKSNSQVPWFGDIPLLGNLFKSRRNNFRRENLIVLVTPHIILNHKDLKAVTDARMDTFYDNRLDDIFGEKGYIKKQKKKSDRRKNYRPSNKARPGGTNLNSMEPGAEE
jgi:general secretion pathway protein D